MMTNEFSSPDLLITVFEHLKRQHEEILDLREELKILREALRRLDHGVFDSALHQAKEGLKKLKTSPDDDEISQEYAVIIQRLKAASNPL